MFSFLRKRIILEKCLFILWCLILTTMLTFLLSNCSRQKQFEQDGKIRLKISIFSTAYFVPVEQKIIDDFEKANPEIKVDLTVSGYEQHHEKIQTQLAGGSAPDVWLTDGVYIMEWAEKDALEDLTELYKTTMNEDEYFGLGALTDINGRLWGIPKEIQTFGLFYNKDIFDKFGMKYPDDAWTWEDVKKTAKALTRDIDDDGRTDIFGIGTLHISNAIYQNGGMILDETRMNSLLNTEIAKESLEYVFWFYKEKCMPSDMVRDSFGGEIELFGAGKLAMFMGQYVYANILKHRKQDLNYAVVLPPKKLTRTCYYNPNSWVITRGRSKEILDAAWRFIQFYSNYESQKILGETSEGLPFNKKAVEYLMNTDYAKLHNLKVFADMVGQSVDADVNGCWREWNDALWNVATSAYAGVMPTEKIPEEAHKAVQKVLDAYYKQK